MHHTSPARAQRRAQPQKTRLERCI